MDPIPETTASTLPTNDDHVRDAPDRGDGSHADMERIPSEGSRKIHRVRWLKLNFTVQTARLQTLKRQKYQHLQEEALLRARGLLKNWENGEVVLIEDLYQNAISGGGTGAIAATGTGTGGASGHDPEELLNYTPEALALRFSLRNDPDILHAVRSLWQVELNRDDMGCIDQRGYASVFRRIAKCLDEKAFKKKNKLDRLLHEDWARDSKGANEMSFAQFFDSIFELADLWCETIDADEYVAFLERLRRCISSGRGGNRVLKPMKQIVAFDAESEEEEEEEEEEEDEDEEEEEGEEVKEKQKRVQAKPARTGLLTIKPIDPSARKIVTSAKVTRPPPSTAAPVKVAAITKTPSMKAIPSPLRAKKEENGTVDQATELPSTMALELAGARSRRSSVVLTLQLGEDGSGLSSTARGSARPETSTIVHSPELTWQQKQQQGGNDRPSLASAAAAVLAGSSRNSIIHGRTAAIDTERMTSLQDTRARSASQSQDSSIGRHISLANAAPTKRSSELGGHSRHSSDSSHGSAMVAVTPAPLGSAFISGAAVKRGGVDLDPVASKDGDDDTNRASAAAAAVANHRRRHRVTVAGTGSGGGAGNGGTRHEGVAIAMKAGVFMEMEPMTHQGVQRWGRPVDSKQARALAPLSMTASAATRSPASPMTGQLGAAILDTDWGQSQHQRLHYHHAKLDQTPPVAVASQAQLDFTGSVVTTSYAVQPQSPLRQPRMPQQQRQPQRGTSSSSSRNEISGDHADTAVLHGQAVSSLLEVAQPEESKRAVSSLSSSSSPSSPPPTIEQMMAAQRVMAAKSALNPVLPVSPIKQGGGSHLIESSLLPSAVTALTGDEGLQVVSSSIRSSKMPPESTKGTHPRQITDHSLNKHVHADEELNSSVPRNETGKRRVEWRVPGLIIQSMEPVPESSLASSSSLDDPTLSARPFMHQTELLVTPWDTFDDEQDDEYDGGHDHGDGGMAVLRATTAHDELARVRNHRRERATAAAHRDECDIDALVSDDRGVHSRFASTRSTDHGQPPLFRVAKLAAGEADRRKSSPTPNHHHYRQSQLHHSAHHSYRYQYDSEIESPRHPLLGVVSAPILPALDLGIESERGQHHTHHYHRHSQPPTQTVVVVPRARTASQRGNGRIDGFVMDGADDDHQERARTAPSISSPSELTLYGAGTTFTQPSLLHSRALDSLERRGKSAQCESTSVSPTGSYSTTMDAAHAPTITVNARTEITLQPTDMEAVVAAKAQGSATQRRSDMMRRRYQYTFGKM